MESPQKPASRRSYTVWLLVLVLLAGFATYHFTGLHSLLTLHGLQDHGVLLRARVAAHPVLAPVLYALAYAVIVTLPLPVAALMTLLAGYLFGLVIGALTVAIGATAGACALFFIARSTLGRTLRERAGPWYEKMAAGMNDNAASYMLFMRLVPVFPFFVVNVIPALFNVSARTYALTTFFGILPATTIYVNLGRTLATLRDTHDLVGAPVLAALALLGILALVPAAWRAIYKRRKGAQAKDPV